ncbi:DciA family protein [Sphingomonas sp. 1P06PA]|uniref:DUF721 domain-containing protein n=1 Tax=Sphingomonas sp. 1P06PA TaxID=554121 RepID=UPI0039A42A78
MTKRNSAPAADRPPERSNRARAVAEMLPAIGGAAFRRFGFVQSSVVSRWPEIVGEKFATASTPESIRFPHGRREEGVLTLTVEGAHAVMIQHVAPTIVERVNRFFGYQAVARVVLRQAAASAPPRARRAPPSLRPIPAELGDSLRTVGDPELRACLEGLASALTAASPAMASIPLIGKADQRR